MAIPYKLERLSANAEAVRTNIELFFGLLARALSLPLISRNVEMHTFLPA
jgi:hypothetical protein